ncbi:amino acid/polyamine/organocation transporter, APC superfamily [Frankia torreyi]|uniref:Amino acid/polyamine/organocation transporter, APC superfamily n=2 Tax=Frankia TaxID=1854 RepID=A0A0D8BBI5_9ACTN|nr:MULTISPECIES: APC family permease [Frankia]KJE20717.1 amino acid/polyamine/organocation transporter, APC superfamily [Frankia torreyi]KQC39132.1 DNA-binding protein [Frankia sp. ACN1ag]
MALTDRLKRGFVGRPIGSDRLGETLLSKRVALPVFASDALSSVSYATEEILLVLSLGGLAFYHLSPWLAGAVIVLMLTVVASYRQNVHAYPSGGGDYEVVSTNLGPRAGLLVGSALLVDYVLTVAVSVSAGVANLTSAVTGLAPHKVIIAVVIVIVLTMMNLRGVRESGTAFAIPTYGFVAGIAVMIVTGLIKTAFGHTPRAESAGYHVVAEHDYAGFALAFLVLRAFASGCTALTGVEAISNGVPAFRKPKSRNAATTLLLMGVIAVAMFAGVTALALISDVHVAEHTKDLVGASGEQPTVIAQVAAAVFGDGSPGFVYIATVTTLILMLAANTAFNGFPVLGSILARDGYLPRQLHTRGDRLAYSNGIVLLAGFAVVLIVTYHAQVTALIQLYILGVFISFTLSQTGMVRHWARILRSTGPSAPDPAGRRRIRRSQTINFIGACLTGTVLVLVLVTKFTHGAWIVCLAIPIIFLGMRGIRGHYDRVAVELTPEPGPPTLPSRIRAVVLVSKIHAPTLRALAYAKASRPHSLVALTVAVDQADADRLRDAWAERGISIDLVVLASPYREVTRPVLDYVARIRRESPRDVVAVYVPEYVVGHWWEHLLHNQSALRLKARLLFQPGVMVTSVPWQLASSSGAERRVERTGAGAVRRGRAALPGPVGGPPTLEPTRGSTGAAGSTGAVGPADVGSPPAERE